MSLPESHQLHTPDSTIPMTPDGSVNWNVHELPHLSSTLYVRPPDDISEKPTAQDIDTMLTFAQQGAEHNPHAEFLGRGNFGIAYKVGNLVLKRARFGNDVDEHVGLGATQAQVAFSEGLDRLKTSHKITAPRPYAVLKVSPDAPTSARTTMLMSHVPGTTPSRLNIGLPNAKKRQALYDAAVQLVGVEPGDIHYDDSPDNLLVVKRRGIVKSVGKLDVAAERAFVERMGRTPTRTYQDIDWS